MKREKLFENAFIESILGFDGERRLITDEYDYARAIINIDNLAKDIIHAEPNIFHVRSFRLAPSYICCDDLRILFGLAMYINSSIIEEIQEHLPFYRLSPLVSGLITRISQLKYTIGLYPNKLNVDRWFFSDSADIESIKMDLNQFVNDFNAEVESDEFIKKHDNFSRLLRKKTKSGRDHIKSIFELYPNVFSTQFQLSYRKDYISENIVTEEELVKLHEKSKADFECLMKNFRSNLVFKHAVGYIWILDYTKRFGFRYNVFIFFEVSNEFNWINSIKKIKDQWFTITENEGLFLDFNAITRNPISRGIGIIRFDDIAMREDLINAACAMIGIGYFTNPIDCKNGRLFGKGLKVVKEQNMAA